MKFRTDIEGLRAVAVITVLGFHAGVPLFAGGYIGVDVFFVISGFLITGLLLSQKKIRLGEFYARRARRILPAAALVLVGTALASWILLPPLRQRDVALDVAGAALNVANWRFIGAQTDYLAAGQAHSPLLHYWSLAVEEQFYLLWAPLLLLLRRFALWAMVAFTGLSFALSLYWTQVSEPLAYLSSPSRAWQFGLGGLLAYVALKRANRSTASAQLSLAPNFLAPAHTGAPGIASSRASADVQSGALGIASAGGAIGARGEGADGAEAPRWWVRRGLSRWARGSAGVLGMAAIVAATVGFSAGTVFPGWAALVPALGAVGIIAAGPRSLVGRLLSTTWVRRLGRLSFAWYLWHWPVLVLTEARTGELPWGFKLALVLASAIPAWLTMRLVEIPLRRSKALSVSPRPSLSFGATMIVVPLTLALVFGSVATRTMAGAAVAAPANLAGAVDGPNLTVTPIAGMFPSPFEARKDHPQIGECQVPPPAVTSPPCLFGSATSGPGNVSPGTGSGSANSANGTGSASNGSGMGSGSPANGDGSPANGDGGEDGGPGRVVLFGDSHAAQWFPAALRLAASRGWTVEVLTKSGCPVPVLPVTNPQLGREYRECDAWRDYALERISSGGAPKLILLGSLNRYAQNEKVLKAAWEEPLRKLRATGAPIVYFRDTPFPGVDVPACLSAGKVCSFSRQSGLWVDPVSDVTIVNVNDVLCPGLECPAVREGVVLYRDDAHLTNTAVTLLAPRVEKMLAGFGVIS